ncbi:DNA-binding response OmpR family regulator [Pedobacter sp. UYP24]
MNKKILIADDDEGIVDATSMMLVAMGYDVIQTRFGGEVPDKILEKPDLLLLDIWMSGMDGRDICKALKADPKTSKLPVLMISASRQIMQSAMDCGADDFLAKPFEMSDLLDKIEKLLKN